MEYEGIVYAGINYVTPVKVKIKDVCFGVGEIDCLECGGTGWWPYGPTENECGACVDCKGTGRRFISSFNIN